MNVKINSVRACNVEKKIIVYILFPIKIDQDCSRSGTWELLRLPVRILFVKLVFFLQRD